MLEPTDIIEVITDTISHKVRITEVQNGKPGVMDIGGVAEDVTIYDFYNKPSETEPQQAIVADPGDTELEILDIPAFPTDNPTQAYIRFAGSGLLAAWHGAQVFRSDDNGDSYNLLAGINTGAIMGTAATTLANGPVNVYDQASTVTVILLNGELESVSELAMLNGKNLAMIGNEIVQFKNAELIDTNKYELSFLIRGRFGTEEQVSLHTSPESFVLLDEKLVTTQNAISLIGLSRKYKAVSVGHTLAQSDPMDFTFTGNCLKPYSPVHIEGQRDGSGNLTISWIRRTRIGGDLRDYADVPLNEEEELYEIDIMNGTDTVRTISGITSAQATYSAAEQTADFGGLQSSVSLKIYQLSSVVGRGKLV